jgi:7-cyano-7-deazaguanine synthase
VTDAAKPLAVICVSGGMDSAVVAALAAENHRLAFLHANYGQKTEARELQAFHELADHYGVRLRLVVDFSALRQISVICFWVKPRARSRLKSNDA